MGQHYLDLDPVSQRRADKAAERYYGFTDEEE